MCVTESEMSKKFCLQSAIFYKMTCYENDPLFDHLSDKTITTVLGSAHSEATAEQQVLQDA